MTTRPVRLLFVIKNLQQGGTETQLLRLVSKLDPARFTFHLCTVADEVHFSDLPPGEPRYRLGAGSSPSRAIAGLARVIDELEPDLIHSFRDQVNLYVRLALRRTRHQPAWLASVRGRPIYPHHLAMYRTLSRRTFAVTVNSAGLAQILVRQGRVPPKKIAVVPNFIDGDRFRPATEEERARARERLELDPQALVALHPARLSYVKNQLGIVLALGLLRRSGRLREELVVLFAGRPRDRVPARLLPEWARFLGVERHVRILGAQPEIVPLYQAADLVLLPSFVEGMPNASLEGQLSGLPNLVTREANRDEIVRDGVSGRVVSALSPWSLADALSELLSRSPEERRRMGLAGREWVMERFDPGAVRERLEALYLSAAASARPAGGRPGAQAAATRA